jgi:hypothetical protein
MKKARSRNQAAKSDKWNTSSHSLESLTRHFITSEHNQNCCTWRIFGACVRLLEWSLALCKECGSWNAWINWMEVAGIIFIATNPFLVVAIFPANHGRSALLAQMVRPCTSMAKITTVDSNGYKCIKCVIRRQIKHSQTVRTCPPNGPRGQKKWILPNSTPLGFVTLGFQRVQNLGTK